MIESLLGLTVNRAISPEVIIGLLTGQYKQYGGVIRWAAGTENAGQIVRHLIPALGQFGGATLLTTSASTLLSTVNTYQLHNLSGQVNALKVATQQVLQIATGTMILSGLNLVNRPGFAGGSVA